LIINYKDTKNIPLLQLFGRISYTELRLYINNIHCFYMIIGNRQVTYSRMLCDCVMQSSTQPRFMQT